MNPGDLVRIVLPAQNALIPPWVGKLAIIIDHDHAEHTGGGQWYMVTFDDKVLNMHEDYLRPV